MLLYSLMDSQKMPFQNGGICVISVTSIAGERPFFLPPVNLFQILALKTILLHKINVFSICFDFLGLFNSSLDIFNLTFSTFLF